MGDETAQQTWQRFLAEYAIARAEHHIAFQVLTTGAFARGHLDSESADSLAERAARQRLLSLRDNLERLEADSRVDASGAVED